LPGLIGSLTLNQRDRPLDVIGPRGLERWFECMSDLHILHPSFEARLHEVEHPGVVYEQDDFEVHTHRLRHRIDTWGYALEEEDRPGRFDVEAAEELGIPSGPLYGRLQAGETIELDDGRRIRPEQVLGPDRPGFKLAYCADTAPTQRAAELAEEADVLVHEATYPAGEEDLAHRRGHSTAGDAARCADEAGAHRLVLTHISQRFTDLDAIAAKAREIFPETVVAEDLMKLDLDRREA
jgi:ribonuclease Z